MSAGDFFEDVVCLCGPDEGLRIHVVPVDVFADGGDELFEVLEGASADALVGQVAEEAFDHVEPGG